jgi:hypothetical protein
LEASAFFNFAVPGSGGNSKQPCPSETTNGVRILVWVEKLVLRKPSCSAEGVQTGHDSVEHDKRFRVRARLDQCDRF